MRATSGAEDLPPRSHLSPAGAAEAASVPATTDLVRAALHGDRAAWDALVERFAPLVAAVIRRHRLDPADAADVNQTVWLRLLQGLPRVREPEALPKWLATATRRECLRMIRSRNRERPIPTQLDAELASLTVDGDVDDALLRFERHQAVTAALAELPQHQRELLLLLIADPPLTYAEISRRLGIPVGSIGPTRGRALRRLRKSPALSAVIGVQPVGVGR